MIACFPVYRTYIDDRGGMSERDRLYFHEAVIKAGEGTQSEPARGEFRFSSIGAAAGYQRRSIPSNQYRDRLHFTLKFQQLTGPVMAKGMEDTTCYVYNRFVSVNEVGGSPAEFGIGRKSSTRQPRAARSGRIPCWPPPRMTPSAVRMCGRGWTCFRRCRETGLRKHKWRRANRRRKRTLADGRSRRIPTKNIFSTRRWSAPGHGDRRQRDREEFVRRIKEYMTKALNEAKVNLSWTSPNPEYQEAVESFISRILRRPRRSIRSGAHCRTSCRRVMYFGALNSLAQIALKLTSSGRAGYLSRHGIVGLQPGRS